MLTPKAIEGSNAKAASGDRGSRYACRLRLASSRLQAGQVLASSNAGYCEDCRRFLGKPINRGNNAYTAMLTHALNTAPERPGSEAAKTAVKAAIEALAQERQASVSPEITAAILAEREHYRLD
jgi:hypothetical protein